METEADFPQNRGYLHFYCHALNRVTLPFTTCSFWVVLVYVTYIQSQNSSPKFPFLDAPIQK